jgi:hypothetical protein
VTVLTTSIPHAIDAILALVRALNMKVDNDPIEIFDGLAGPNVPDIFVQIGGVEQVTADGTQQWHSLGSTPGIAPPRDENYQIRCGVFAYIGGADADVSTASDAQKAARDIAFTVLAAIETGLRTNPKLLSADAGADGLIDGGLGTGWVEFGGHLQLEETTRDDPEAGKGRRAVVLFEIGVFKRLFSN